MFWIQGSGTNIKRDTAGPLRNLAIFFNFLAKVYIKKFTFPGGHFAGFFFSSLEFENNSSGTFYVWRLIMFVESTVLHSILH